MESKLMFVIIVLLSIMTIAFVVVIWISALTNDYQPIMSTNMILGTSYITVR